MFYHIYIQQLAGTKFDVQTDRNKMDRDMIDKIVDQTEKQTISNKIKQFLLRYYLLLHLFSLINDRKLVQGTEFLLIELDVSRDHHRI